MSSFPQLIINVVLLSLFNSNRTRLEWWDDYSSQGEVYSICTLFLRPLFPLLLKLTLRPLYN